MVGLRLAQLGQARQLGNHSGQTGSHPLTSGLALLFPYA